MPSASIAADEGEIEIVRAGETVTVVDEVAVSERESVTWTQ